MKITIIIFCLFNLSSFSQKLESITYLNDSLNDGYLTYKFSVRNEHDSSIYFGFMGSQGDTTAKIINYYTKYYNYHPKRKIILSDGNGKEFQPYRSVNNGYFNHTIYEIKPGESICIVMKNGMDDKKTVHNQFKLEGKIAIRFSKNRLFIKDYYKTENWCMNCYLTEFILNIKIKRKKNGTRIKIKESTNTKYFGRGG